MNAGLVPGAKALTLPTPHAAPTFFYLEVVVVSSPHFDNCIGCLGLHRLMVCEVDCNWPGYVVALGCTVGWPADALLPLPGDEDAERFELEKLRGCGVPA